jgi:hypothetical protein
MAIPHVISKKDKRNRIWQMLFCIRIGTVHNANNTRDRTRSNLIFFRAMACFRVNFHSDMLFQADETAKKIRASG